MRMSQSEQEHQIGLDQSQVKPFRIQKSRELITQTRQGLRRIESSKRLSFVITDQKIQADSGLLNSTAKVPIAMIKLFSFELDQQLEHNEAPNLKAGISDSQTSDSWKIADTPVTTENIYLNRGLSSPNARVFELSDSPASKKKASLETPRFSTAVDGTWNIFNRPKKIKVVLQSSQTRLSQSMTHDRRSQDSLPELRVIKKPLRSSLSLIQSQESINPRPKVSLQKSSQHLSPKPERQKNSPGLLGKPGLHKNSHNTSSGSCPILLRRKRSVKTRDKQPRGDQSGKTRITDSPLLGRNFISTVDPKDQSRKITDIQQVLKLKNPLASPGYRNVSFQPQELDTSSGLHKKLGPFFFKKR